MIMATGVRVQGDDGFLILAAYAGAAPVAACRLRRSAKFDLPAGPCSSGYDGRLEKRRCLFPPA